MYDPDPIASLRKRRVSTDSHDSGGSHGELRTHEIIKKSSKLVDNSFPSEKKKSKSSEGKIKKKHKKCHKHGHHHCHKHKHKRHKSGESSSKKSFEQKFAIRSPPHGSHYVKSDHDNESSEASQEESDQQNSSDEEVGFQTFWIKESLLAMQTVWKLSFCWGELKLDKLAARLVVVIRLLASL